MGTQGDYRVIRSGMGGKGELNGYYLTIDKARTAARRAASKWGWAQVELQGPAGWAEVEGNLIQNEKGDDQRDARDAAKEVRDAARDRRFAEKMAVRGGTSVDPLTGAKTVGNCITLNMGALAEAYAEEDAKRKTQRRETAKAKRQTAPP